ncbi:membrane-spanning 4-domains subfamily A member 8-like [Danio aesculapii]|uniref:membrane-spanning 4-domains subfamily A member 8-like n=1 Tax=Danio aesculapii TaxID=1142201 RepID=UPI0024BFB0A3|nr:membrane-spanning 4-domains subfamily A member 8-like [Danio aesculapii]
MESSKIISTEKATVVIQINPQVTQHTVNSDDGQEAKVLHHNTPLQGFFKSQPKALGTVQIMIGVIVFLLGTVLTSNVRYQPTIVVFSGITFWGSFIYISAGSLSVVAQNHLHLCVVKASLGMNVLSTVTSGIAIILLGIDLGLLTSHLCDYSSYHKYDAICEFHGGILGILLIFSLLQFVISICISGFACKATCNSSSVVNVVLNQAI